MDLSPFVARRGQSPVNGYVVATADIVNDILEVVRQGNFGTVVVGRYAGPLLQEALRHHICHELIKKARGVTVWVVE